MNRNGWTRNVTWENEVAEAWIAQGGPPAATPQAWEKDDLAALLGLEQWHGEARPRWHLSLQHKERVPNWNELADAAHSLRPGVPFCMGVPPRSLWMNVHDRVLHMWEARDPGLLEEWRINAKGHTPT